MDAASIGQLIDEKIAEVKEAINAKVDALQDRLTELQGEIDQFQARNEQVAEVPTPDDAEVPEDDEDEGAHIEHH